VKTKIIMLFVFISFIIVFSGSKAGEEPLPYKDPILSIEARVEDLLNRMTLEEKIDILGGTGFETKAIKRLDIPPLNMTDGPAGVRWEEATAFPVGIAMASTWEPELIYKVGSAIADEVKAKGRHVILGPCVNIARIPMGGRNFESFGEDPFLNSRITADYIKGVQDNNVVATVKHFACNNQEYERNFVDVQIGERALNEIYLPAFKTAVTEANVLAVMAAYNKVNGHYCSENDYLLLDKLKKEWEFNGLVMSDWGAVHSTLPTVKSGLDLEMPFGKYLNKGTLLDAIKSGDIKESVINDKVKRILRVMFKIGLFDNYKYDPLKLNTKEHQELALEVAKEGIVLLKNENNILPLDLNKIKSIAVIGPNGNVTRTGGGGSSMVNPFYSISPLEALEKKIGNKVKINFSLGVSLSGDTKPIEARYFHSDNSSDKAITAEFFNNKELKGEPVAEKKFDQINFNWGGKAPFVGLKEDEFSIRFTTTIKAPETGEFTFDVNSDDGVRFYIDDELVINDWTNHAALSNFYKVKLEKDKTYKIKLEFYEDGGSASVKLGWELPHIDPFRNAVSLANSSDIAILFVGTSDNYESEGFDRPDLILPAIQDKLIEAVTDANKNTIVVLTTGSPVLMDKWIDKVDGIIEAWFAGEQAGNAIADVLLGNYNPSGKLPITFPKRWEDCSAFGTYHTKDSVTEYSDGIFVGYRHFDKNNIEPLFPFGFGLSYTSFTYENLKINSKILQSSDELKFTVDIKNTGNVNGAEIAQVYLSDLKSSVERPVKELKAFKKVFLREGESKTLEFSLDKSSLSFFDPEIKNWRAERGEFEILVGSSSKDIRLREKFTLK
jgi:beta-glucosidase